MLSETPEDAARYPTVNHREGEKTPKTNIHYLFWPHKNTEEHNTQPAKNFFNNSQ